MSSFSDQMDQAGLLPKRRETSEENQSVESRRENGRQLPVGVLLLIGLVGLVLLFIAAGGTIVVSVG